jgi:hypothetical protein
VSAEEQAAPPALRIVRGNPRPEEIAALLGVVMSLGGGAPEREPAASPWAAGARRGRYAPRPSGSAWRLSLRAR